MTSTTLRVCFLISLHLGKFSSKAIFLVTLTLFSFPSSASLFSINETEVLKVASESAYHSRPDLQPGDLDRESDLLSIRCFSDQDCYASISYKVVPTLSKALSREDDGNCFEKLDYQSINVTIYASGKTVVIESDSQTSSAIDCNLVPANRP